MPLFVYISGFRVVEERLNIIYDLSESILGTTVTNDFIDTQRFAKYCDIEVDNYKLSTLAEKLDVKNEKAHRSLYDCKATHLVYQRLKDCFDSKKAASVRERNKSNADSGKVIFEIDMEKIIKDALAKGIISKEKANALLSSFSDEEKDRNVSGHSKRKHSEETILILELQGILHKVLVHKQIDIDTACEIK